MATSRSAGTSQGAAQPGRELRRLTPLPRALHTSTWPPMKKGMEEPRKKRRNSCREKLKTVTKAQSGRSARPTTCLPK